MAHFTSKTTLVVGYNVTTSTVGTEDPDVVDALCDAEDDIVNAAVYEYVTNHEGIAGDNVTMHLVVFFDQEEQPPHYVVVPDKDAEMFAHDLPCITSVDVTVSAASVRF